MLLVITNLFVIVGRVRRKGKTMDTIVDFILEMRLLHLFLWAQLLRFS